MHPDIGLSKIQVSGSLDLLGAFLLSLLLCIHGVVHVFAQLQFVFHGPELRSTDSETHPSSSTGQVASPVSGPDLEANVLLLQKNVKQHCLPTSHEDLDWIGLDCMK